MARVCDICGKSTMFGNNVSKSYNHTHRTWKPNLIKVKALFGGTTRTLKICTQCYRSDFVEKKVRVPKESVVQTPEHV
ncbi:MAG: 50S ribosomal protein L28 [Treponema sp.]|nr:50S ribosomal protein L28 [Treponema sp.]